MISMRGLTTPVNELLQWVGLILISIIMYVVIINWAAGGAHVQRGIEQGSLMYTIANSVNALSGMEEGQVTRQLVNLFDITVECPAGACYVETLPYDTSLNPQKSSNKVLILGDIEPVSLKKVNKITLTKERGKKIVLTGSQTEDKFLTQLSLPDYSPMCITTHPDVRKYLSDPEINQGLEPELIAAFIQAESSWNARSNRYEPGFQVRNLEGKEMWTSRAAWLKSGITIGQWFDQNPGRSSERDSLTEEQLGLVAQTRASSSYGLMQILYTTAVENCESLEFNGAGVNLDNPDELYRPDLNIFCGVSYLKKLSVKYPDIRDLVSAYNAGSPLWTLNLKNREYTMKVLGYYTAFKKCAA
jgi:hypothetical protein